MNEIIKIKEEIEAVVTLNGFNQFILIDSEGCIIQQKIKLTKSLLQTQALAKLITTIKSHASVIGKDKFKTFTISRKTGQNIFIFPIGKCYLGVIKSTNVNEPSNIDDHLNSLVNSQVNNLIINLMNTIKHS